MSAAYNVSSPVSSKRGHEWENWSSSKKVCQLFNSFILNSNQYVTTNKSKFPCFDYHIVVMKDADIRGNGAKGMCELLFQNKKCKNWIKMKHQEILTQY